MVIEKAASGRRVERGQAGRQQLLQGGEKINNLIYIENLQAELLTEAAEGVTT